ncbi:hypothetical protein MMC14_002123 [Varicellaria rhodocarpa]|nr:hypothetical protein [Varicellaria rhodocarpa]
MEPTPPTTNHVRALTHLQRGIIQLHNICPFSPFLATRYICWTTGDALIANSEALHQPRRHPVVHLDWDLQRKTRTRADVGLRMGASRAGHRGSPLLTKTSHLPHNDGMPTPGPVCHSTWPSSIHSSGRSKPNSSSAPGVRWQVIAQVMHAPPQVHRKYIDFAGGMGLDVVVESGWPSKSDSFTIPSPGSFAILPQT